MYENIIVEKLENGVGLIRLDRPRALNSLNAALMQEMIAAVTANDEDAKIGCHVITGNKKVFAAGADIKEMSEAGAVDMLYQDLSMWDRVGALTKPVVAAVSGVCLGGGCELAMACDIRVASEDAKFGQPEINLAIIPGYGGTQRMARLIGTGKAKELIYTGEMIDATEAMRIGLVDRVVKKEDLLGEAKQLATKILEKGPLAVKAAKRAINEGVVLPLREGLKVETRYFSELFDTEDKNEGATAFLEKRKPTYKGK